MKYSQKIKEILKAREISQEELARNLDVTFSALNRWVGAASEPRKSNKIRIDEMYSGLFYLTLEDSETLKLLEKNKKEILEKCDGLNINNLLKRSDFIKNLSIKLTYTSNKLEGSTMTESEVSDVLYENLSFSNRSLIEHIEAKNHETTMGLILNNYKNKTITEDYIKNLHKTMMNSIKNDAGNYRNHNVRIAGSFVPTANYLSVEKRMGEFLTSVNKKLSNKKDAIFKFMSESHAEFEMIHPFSDGNGRVGRLLLMHLALHSNILPPIILHEHRKKYLESLQKAQLENNYQNLELLLIEAVNNTFDIV